MKFNGVNDSCGLIAPPQGVPGVFVCVCLGSASGISPLFVIRRLKGGWMDGCTCLGFLLPHVAPCGQKEELKGWGHLTGILSPQLFLLYKTHTQR